MERPKKQITRLEYIEMSAREIRKFKHLEPISDADINNVNWEELTQKLASVPE